MTSPRSPRQDAAAIVALGPTEFARRMPWVAAAPHASSCQVGDARTWLVTSREGGSTSAILGRAA